MFVDPVFRNEKFEKVYDKIQSPIKNYTDEKEQVYPHLKLNRHQVPIERMV